MHRRMLLLVLWVVRRPIRTLLISAIVLLASVLLAMARLNVSSDQNKLFSPSAPFFRDYLSFVKKFPENEAIYLLVEPADRGKTPAVASWAAVADALVDRMKRLPEQVRSVDGRVPIDKLGSQGLLFDSPARVRETLADAKRFIPLVKLWAEAPNPLERLLGPTPIERFLSGLVVATPDAETERFVSLLADSWTATIRVISAPPNIPDLASLDARDPSRLGYYFVPDANDPARKLLLVRVYPRVEYTSLTAVTEAVDAIRDAAKQTIAKFPEFTVGVTGRPALEADEMRTTDEDSTKAEIVALTVVFIALVLFFHSFRIAFAAELSLAVAVGWTFGWATFTIGELNLLSIVFLIALIGIGMDYLIQILARYRDYAGRYGGAGAWVRVFDHVGPPINTACLGAAGAFLVAIFTDFRGAAQLGIIAGGGLLLCLVSGYTVLPALLTLLPPKNSPLHRGIGGPSMAPVTLPIKDTGEPPVPRLNYAVQLSTNRAWAFALPVIWIVLLLIGMPFMLRAHFDPGLLDLQSRNLESVQLVRKLDTWSAVVLSKDLDDLRRVRDRTAKLSVVASTDSLLLAQDNAASLTAQKDVLPAISWTDPTRVEASRIDDIAAKAEKLAAKFSPAKSVDHPLSRFAVALRSSDGAAAADNLSAWQGAFVGQLKQTLAQFSPQTLRIDELPIELRGHYAAADGTYALYLYPKEDLWKREHLREFVMTLDWAVAEVPGAHTLTGIAPNIYHSTRSIESSFYKTTAYALALIFLLVLLDFRRLVPTLLAVSVLAFGLPMLVALMGLLDVSWNFANFFGLPILIGAGHEYGVFMVHRYLESVKDPRKNWPRWDVADGALLLCAFVTCSAFAFFWLLGHHEGLRSLGLVMALGSGCIYLATLMVVRPILKWNLAARNAALPRHETSD